MKRVLFISIAFPPKNDPECLQVAKYFRYLSRADLKIDVVTSSNPTLNMAFDAKLSDYDSGYDQKIEIAVKENKYLNYIFRKTGIVKLNKPDSKYRFIRGDNQVIKELRNKPEVIYSRSFPISSTLLAEKLVDYYQVPWIIHLSDPWTLSAIHDYGGDLKKWHESRERRVFSKADSICFTSRQTVEAYSNKYPEYTSKFKLFHNVIDPKIQKSSIPVMDGTLNFTYTGGLAGSRSAEPILKAFKTLYNSDPKIFDNVLLHFAGSIDRFNMSIFSRYPLPFLRTTGALSFEKAIALQDSSQVLLLIDTPIPIGETAFFLPSKLPDYLASGKRIIAITNKYSPSDDFIDVSFGDKFYYGENQSLGNAILTCIAAFNRKDTGYFVNSKALPAIFEAPYQAKRLAELLENTIATNKE